MKQQSVYDFENIMLSQFVDQSDPVFLRIKVDVSSRVRIEESENLIQAAKDKAEALTNSGLRITI